jgi:hypothetical protein
MRHQEEAREREVTLYFESEITIGGGHESAFYSARGT